MLKQKKNVQGLILLLGCTLLIITGAVQAYKKFKPIPCANSISCGEISSNLSDKTEGVWMNKGVKSLSTNYFAQNSKIARAQVLGDANEKVIFIDLTKQRLYAFQGNALIFNFLISSGLYNLSPTGTFHIGVKMESTHMEGGDPAYGDFYNLYNVPWTMFFGNDQVPWSLGYSTHGKYWNDIYGRPSSHGCINMQIADAKQLYDWADPPSQGFTTYASKIHPGTKLIIYGKYVPQS